MAALPGSPAPTWGPGLKYSSGGDFVSQELPVPYLMLGNESWIFATRGPERTCQPVWGPGKVVTSDPAVGVMTPQRVYRDWAVGGLRHGSPLPGVLGCEMGSTLQVSCATELPRYLINAA